MVTLRQRQVLHHHVLLDCLEGQATAVLSGITVLVMAVLSIKMVFVWGGGLLDKGVETEGR